MDSGAHLGSDLIGPAGAGLLLHEIHSGPLAIRPIEPAPCTAACPAGINVKAYVSLISEGRFGEALEVVRRHCPLPSICGRVCHHPCEAACLRASVDAPIAIRALKRFVADAGLVGSEAAPMPDENRAEKVAVVGSGPAGLTAAYDLRLQGYPVTIFEAAPKPGGMLRYGIADYRLPPDVLDAEIAILCRTGIDIRTETSITGLAAVEDLLADGYDAVLLAVGAQRGRKLGIPGDDGPGVDDALAFLRRVNEGGRLAVPDSVVVVGGGSTAIEAARVALRLGADNVKIVYRRTWEEMPAGEDEVVIAAAEGVKFQFLASPGRVVAKDGSLVGLECLQVALGEPDDGGRRRPVPMPGTEFVVPAGLILAAVGQQADLDRMPASDAMIERGLVIADAETTMTLHEAVFAAGDVVTGPATVVEAIAAGHRAAEAIIGYLGGRGMQAAGVDVDPAELGVPDPVPPTAERVDPKIKLPGAGREFAEVEQAFEDSEAIAEASRCLRCGPCGECEFCAPSCGRRHVLLSDWQGGTVRLRVPAALAFAMESGNPTAGTITVSGGATSVEAVPIRVGYFEDRCRGCSLCLDTCQFSAIAKRDPLVPESRIDFDPALCRGCLLCTVACPTAALVSTAYNPVWWSRRLDQIVAAAITDVVVTCESGHAEASEDALVMRFPCAGGVHAGMLLDLCRRGARVQVAGCIDGECRYSKGAASWRRQVEDARALLQVLGADEDRVVAAPGLATVGGGS